MKKTVLVLMFLICCNAASQITLNLQDKGKQPHQTVYKGNNIYTGALTMHRQNEDIPPVPEWKNGKSRTALPLIYYTLLFINPMLVIEDGKAYLGLTKEISFGYYPLGRAAFEYSYIFRDKNTSHLRFSYNYDIALEAADFFAIVTTPGAGYFTDTHNKGWFGQIAGGLIIATDFLIVYPYIRYRHTFVQNKAPGKTDIDDISLGSGIVFFLNGM